jgi:hypothetical protein
MAEEFNYKVAETTRNYIKEKLEKEFKKTGNSIYVEEPFLKLVVHHVMKEVPAYLRTEDAVKTNPQAILELERTIEKFLYDIESKRIGWQYCLRKDGHEELKLFNENGITEIIDYNNNPQISRRVSEEEKFSNLMKRVMKDIKNNNDNGSEGSEGNE